MESNYWTFPTLAHVWEYRNRAIVAGGDRLDALAEPERQRSLADLNERVRTLVAQCDDGWLVTTAFCMVEDLYKSFFRDFGWSPGVHDYIAATAQVVMDELSRRGFTLHYVVDCTQPDVNLAIMLADLPKVFHAAGLAVVGPQLVAVEILEEAEGHPPTDMASIQRYRDEGYAIANELIRKWHLERRSSAYFNLDRDDDLPGFTLEAARSRDGIPGNIMVFRDQPPAEGSTAAISPPEGVVMPPEMLEHPAN
jgi:hypothetical protein